MSAVNLVFAGSQVAQPVELVFGASGIGGVVSDATIEGGDLGPIDAPSFSGAAHLGVRMGGDLGALALPTFASVLVYATNTARPLIAHARTTMQEALPLIDSGVQTRMQDALRTMASAQARFADGAPLPAPVAGRFQVGTAIRQGGEMRFQDALRLPPDAMVGRFQTALSVRQGGAMRFQTALMLRARSAPTRFQQGVGVRGGGTVRFQDGLPFVVRHGEVEGYGLPIRFGRTTRYQEAIRPPPGISSGGGATPPPHVCYTPSGNLVFEAPWSPSTDLLFVCEGHDDGGNPGEPTETVVVPIRRVYIVLNSASLRRVDGNIFIPTFSMSLSVDVDSWTWGFDASVPTSEEPNLEPSSYGDPVELELMVNGVAYRVLAENMERQREFGRAVTNIHGRGKAAVLDSPYVPAMNFVNDADRTAQQLMNDVLTLNGVSIGWDIDWGITDWTIPAGLFSMQGSYVGALDTIAKAAGAYLQPVPVDQTFRVLPRYAELPRDWDELITPDYELPVDVTVREGIEWIDKPRYNRVYVSGWQAGGRTAVITLSGTAGDVLAPQVVDPLNTAVEVSRQRGRAVLGDTGRQANVSLRTPVLAETGIITPGKFVRYVDGGVTRLGVVRKTGVDIGMPEIWQTLAIETHVIAA